MQPNPEYVTEIKEIINKAPFPNHMVMELKEMNIDSELLEWLDVKTFKTVNIGGEVFLFVVFCLPTIFTP